MKSFYKEKVDRFIESDEGKRCCNPTTIGASAEMRRYLENRIREAFAAGWNAGAERYHNENSV